MPAGPRPARCRPRERLSGRLPSRTGRRPATGRRPGTPSGHLKITGRKKEIIVTAGGKNVSPGPMEDILRSAPLISQAM
ncbi:hypothetical protein, partial [Corynebacterium bovis]|uniref:hypothetical protein n=1 Tax=Corynebacterium bovis TaxID=36808 RepID=UPI001639EEFB